MMINPIIRIALSGVLIFQSGLVWSYDDAFSSHQRRSHFNSFQPNPNQYLPHKNYFNSLSLNHQTWVKPDLDINRESMKLPVIQVRDIGNSVWSYEKLKNNFNPGIKAYDHYGANLHFNFNGIQAPNQIQMNLGNMKFDRGSLIPKSYRKNYQDTLGNSLSRERTNQFGSHNDKYNTYIQFYQRKGKLNERGPEFRAGQSSRPPKPTQELVEGFQENWNMTYALPGGGRAITKSLIQIDSIKHETNLNRYVSEYGGKVRANEEVIAFKVTSPTDINGNVQSLQIEMWGKNSPKATVNWTPVEGIDNSQAFSLLRENLPVPIMVGPNSGLRMNGVDLPEAPLQVTSEGHIDTKQLGSTKDLVNLMGREDVGINISFSPPAADSPKAGFSFGNSVRNLWTMVTGRWSEVKGMRQELSAMQENDPTKFVLSAGFRDPGFMGIKDLGTAIEKHSQAQSEFATKISPGNKNFLTEYNFQMNEEKWREQNPDEVLATKPNLLEAGWKAVVDKGEDALKNVVAKPIIYAIAIGAGLLKAGLNIVKTFWSATKALLSREWSSVDQNISSLKEGVKSTLGLFPKIVSGLVGHALSYSPKESRIHKLSEKLDNYSLWGVWINNQQLQDAVAPIPGTDILIIHGIGNNIFWKFGNKSTGKEYGFKEFRRNQLLNSYKSSKGRLQAGDALIRDRIDFIAPYTGEGIIDIFFSALERSGMGIVSDKMLTGYKEKHYKMVYAHSAGGYVLLNNTDNLKRDFTTMIGAEGAYLQKYDGLDPSRTSRIAHRFDPIPFLAPSETGNFIGVDIAFGKEKGRTVIKAHPDNPSLLDIQKNHLFIDYIIGDMPRLIRIIEGSERDNIRGVSVLDPILEKKIYDMFGRTR